MQKQPILTITMIVRNEEKHMSLAINSLISQTYSNFKLVIVNNGSKDSTGEIADNFSALDPRITVMHFEQNDPFITYQMIESTQTPYYMFAAGHDYYAPSFIEKCVTALESDPHVVLAYPRAAWFKNDKVIGEIPGIIDTRGMDSLARTMMVTYGLVEAYQFYGVYRLAPFKSLGRYHVIGADHVLLTELALWGSFALVDETLFFLRMAEDWGNWEVYRKKLLPGETDGASAFLKMIAAYMTIADKVADQSNKEILKQAFFTACLLRHGSSLAMFGESLDTLFTKPGFKELLETLRDTNRFIQHNMQTNYSISPDKPDQKASTDHANLSLVQSELQECEHRSQPEPTSKPLIIVDGVFFQLMNTGIARLWHSLLEQWAKTDFASSVILLDRAGTAPPISGIRCEPIPAYDYNNTEIDRQMLQSICDSLGASLFVSTYYTTPISTPSVFYAYDMIPEVLNTPYFNLNDPMWREKHAAIAHATSFIAISRNTALDLIRFIPVAAGRITVAYPAVDTAIFYPSPENELALFKEKHGISRPYFIFIGSRQNYKNGALFFKGFAGMADKSSYELVCIGGYHTLEDSFAQLVPDVRTHILHLPDEELRAAYSGATALVYPSLYEGFGLPILEAMACDCPVITCQNSSIPEAAGAAALYVEHNKPEEVTTALQNILNPDIRGQLIKMGRQQLKKFSWNKMANDVKSALQDTINTIQTLRKES